MSSSSNRAHARMNRVVSHMTGAPAQNQGVRANPTSSTGERAVIVSGARTPFVKSFTTLMENDSISLAVAAIDGLIKKTKLDPEQIDEVIMGNVVVSSASPNLAREAILDLNLPKHIPGTTVSIACLSGLQCVATAAAAVEHGDAEVVIAGGSDSLSSGELPMPAKLTRALGKYQLGGGQKKGWTGVKEMLTASGPPTQWVPQPNSIAERSTGKTMGYHADLMAEINAVPRNEQDELALASHRNANIAAPKLAPEIVPVTTPQGKVVSKDNIIRANMDASKVASLGPAFRPAGQGTVTAATSSPLTDGASAVLVMSESKAKALGYPTDITVASYIKTAIDPFPQLLLAPAIAIPRALEKAGLTLEDIDIFEIHEAFAAQVLATIKALASDEFCQKRLGKDKALGEIPLSKVNPNGGSIAIGHPFAATGGRLVTSAAEELRRSNKRYCLISICAAGGIGGVMILENRGAAQ